jgi:hypothetical protein
MASNTSVVFGVPKILQKDVECFIVNEFAGEEGVVIHTFPSAIPGIVFHHNQGRPAIEQIMTPAGRKFSPPTLFLHGTGSESSVMCFTKGSYSVTDRRIFHCRNASHAGKGKTIVRRGSKKDVAPSGSAIIQIWKCFAALCCLVLSATPSPNAGMSPPPQNGTFLVWKPGDILTLA